MEVHYGFEGVENIQNAILTIGTFDGVHVGHQKIIERLNKEAEKVNGNSVVFTFFPHPRMVINPDNHGLKLIQTQEEKIETLRKLGLKHLIIFPFTKEFAEVTAGDFVKKYLVEKLNVKTIVVGYDHQFGKNREGSLSYLQKVSTEYNFNVIEIPAHEIDEVNVSSTKIRKAIESGDIRTANAYLAQPFQLTGTVIHGNKLGRTIGYPTANIQVNDPLKIIPAIGIYTVKVLFGDNSSYYGMMSIGTNPTVTDTENIKIEVFIFDFEKEIYGEQVVIQLFERTRGEYKFESIEKLKERLHQDEVEIRTYFGLPH